MAAKPSILNVYSLMLLGSFLVALTALVVLLMRASELLGTANPITLLTGKA